MDSPALRKRSHAVLHDIDIAPARIHPLSDVTKKTRRIRVIGVETTGHRPIFVEPGHPAADPAHPQVAPQSLQ